MKFELVMPVILTIIMLLAVVGYLCFGKPVNWQMVFYYLFAAGINVTVIFPQLIKLVRGN